MEHFVILREGDREGGGTILLSPYMLLCTSFTGQQSPRISFLNLYLEEQTKVALQKFFFFFLLMNKDYWNIYV